ncbi:MAG: M6 family metalloprotease domain-containing protein, partial [Clostridium sp.]|nr:M6 family metalloprotease domain-containing protein [Clostridium sp.]
MKVQKRYLSIILIIIMILNFNFTVNAASNNKEIDPIANIVYFVDFNDSQGNFIDGKMDMVKDMFNGEKDTSLSSYIKKISYDQMNVHNYFPQEDNGVITPYRLSKNRSYYNKNNEYEMIDEVIKNVQVDTNYNIDMNNDGYVDNVIFVFQGRTTSKDDVLWPHKANHNGASSINGKKVDVYNLHNSYRLIDDILGGEGVLAHEFLHSVGYPDLYTSSGARNPVGIWDIMASVSPFLQYPLAYTRSAISNWLTIDTITESGSYTLKPSSSQDGNQAFILKTPMSNNEFFVVEYRKKGNPYKGELDGKIPGSGLIIYRVNTDENTNFVGDKDYI